jgi:hypothetical protein
VNQPQPEVVTNLKKLRDKQYEVSLTFSGEAAEAMMELMTDLEVDSANEVAKRAIALLLEAQGKDIMLRDRQTGKTTAIAV